MKVDKTKLIIFDLGNVIFRIDWFPMFKSWENASGISAQILQDRFNFDNNYSEFERGNITGREFANSVNNSLGINITFSEFKSGWNAIFMEVLPDIESILKHVSSHTTIVAYSNTNEVHYEVMRQKYSTVFQYFDKIFKSFEMRTRKPEFAGFMQILKEYDCKPEEAMFFDDLEVNVRSATELGINAILVDHINVLKSVLMPV